MLCCIFLWASTSLPVAAQDFNANPFTGFTGEDEHLPLPKVNHAEPLFIDLIRDLGAHKGEREWNIGFGHDDAYRNDEFHALIEYEWAAFNRLGFEVEVPMKAQSPNNRPSVLTQNSIRNNRGIESLKLATQWTFAVWPKQQTSLAIGYIHELLMPSLVDIPSNNLHQGNVYNPFFVAAKNWGSGFHTLLYTGPKFHQVWGHSWHANEDKLLLQSEISGSAGIFDKWETEWCLNFNAHYMLPNSRNFVGLECNMEQYSNVLYMTLRPQMRLVLSNRTLIGLIASIPVDRSSSGLGAFTRLIYELPHKSNRANKH